MSQARKVAVVGSGVAGLTAAYVLQRHGAEVTLFEKDDRLGGHAHTHEVVDSRGYLQRADTGFIVHNRRTYPTLLRLFSELGVQTRASDMSMSVVCEGCGLEYAGARGITGLFPTLRSADPRFLRMLAEVRRFHRLARSLLRVVGPDEALGTFLDRGRFTPYFRSHFMTPLVACVWSCAPSDAERYPARYLFAFLDHHGTLQVTGSPTWRTVVGGSARYVERVAKGLTAVRTSTPVRHLSRTTAGVSIRDADDERHDFDAAVVATHPHQALALLADPTPSQREVLGAITYTANRATLHTDASLLPRSRGAQASWNYRMPSCRGSAASVLVSYDLNRLQGLDSPERYVATLNAGGQVDPSSVLTTLDYEHPLYTPTSVAAQRRLPELSDGALAFAGAYHGWGFHEDGARSGVEAARLLGATW